MKLPCLSDPESIVKVGEGTFGEAFQAGNTVCKVVPIDGDLKVNGEVQKVLIFISSAVFATIALGKWEYLPRGR